MLYFIIQTLDNFDRHTNSNKHKIGKRAKEMDKNYSKCLNVLLSKSLTSSTSESSVGHEEFMKQIRMIINKRDNRHNTPLHYATLNWPQQTVRKLLNNGANVGMKNIREEIPLSRINPDTLQDFLDESCMVADGYDMDEDTDNEEDTGKTLNDDEEEVENIHCDPDFFTNLNQSDVTFKYGFLAPPITEDQLKKWDEEKQDDLEELALPETDSLLYISQSKEHRHLVTHPVIKSYLWIKWKRMRKFYNRNVRVYLLFVMCLTWYIVAQFGGKKWNKLNTNEDSTNTDIESKAFCKEELPPTLSFTKPGHYGFWYAIFTIQAIIQVIWIVIDIKRDIPKKCGTEGGCGNCCSAFISFCSASWIDLLLLSLIIITLIGTTEVLWLDLTILFGFMAVRELLQMASSLTSYVSNLGNRLDIALLSLVAVILYVPNSLLINGTAYTLGLNEDGDSNKEKEKTNDCSIKRCMAAAVILISWIRLLTSVLRNPRLGKANVYLTMFRRVMHSFFRFLAWYAVLLVAFGLGFYIMLHKDVGKPKEVKKEPEGKVVCKKEDPYEFFDTPWLALVKTTTMFIGEIEFSDIPIEGGNFSVTFGYLFLMSFVFLVVMVLMNLLNGLAVSDIADIVNASEIECQISTINTISYFESILLGDPLEASAQNQGCCQGLKRLSLLQVRYSSYHDLYL